LELGKFKQIDSSISLHMHYCGNGISNIVIYCWKLYVPLANKMSTCSSETVKILLVDLVASQMVKDTLSLAIMLLIYKYYRS
jgi:hypothetical protein